VTAELASEGKLSELVADHLLGDIDRNEVLAIVDRKCESHELRWDIAVASPCAKNFLLSRFDHGYHLPVELLINVGAFAGRAGHREERYQISESSFQEKISGPRVQISKDAWSLIPEI
jgi:hypothetical protein